MAEVQTPVSTNLQTPAAPPVASNSSPSPVPAAGGGRPAPEATKPAATQTPPKPGTAEATPPKAEEQVSPKLQALVTREKRALEAERLAKTTEEKVAAREKALEAREAVLKEFEAIKSTDPMKALQMLGLTYQQLTEIALNDGKVPADQQVQRLQERIDAQEKAREKEKQDAAEAARQQAQAREAQAIEDFKSEIATYVDENAKTYEFAAFEGDTAKRMIFDVINEHYERTTDPKTGRGKILSIEDATKKVEEYLEKKFEPFFGLEKVKPKLAPPKRGDAPKQQTNPPGQKSQTLNNAMSATPSPRPTRVLTDEERAAKAIAWLRGNRGV